MESVAYSSSFFPFSFLITMLGSERLEDILFTQKVEPVFSRMGKLVVATVI